MNKIIKYVKVIRNNWKKSAFACVVLSYGAKYGHDQYRFGYLFCSMFKFYFV